MAEPMNSDTASDRFPWSTVASDGVKFEAFNVTDVQRILDHEVEGWAWLSSPRDGQFTQVVEWRNRLTRAKATLASKEYHDGKLIEILETISEYLNFSPPIHHRSAIHTFLRKFGADNPVAARVTLGLYLQAGGQIRRYIPTDEPLDVALGVSQWMEWRRMSGLDDAAQSAHIKTLAEQIREAEALRNEVAESADIATKHRKAISELHHRLGDVVEERLAKWEEANISLSRRSQEELQRIATTYEERMALEAPSTYWRKKASIHADSAKRFAIWTGIVGVVGGAVMAWLLHVLLRDNTMQAAGPAVLAAVVFLWILKTLLRMTMSHVHLHFDATERRTMVVSYIALSRKREVATEERTALAAAIFRPTGDGIVKEESPPTPLWELLKGGR